MHCYVTYEKTKETSLYNFTKQLSNYISDEPTYSLRSWDHRNYLYSLDYLLGKLSAPSPACWSSSRFQ
jgi:hypothetical protein